MSSKFITTVILLVVITIITLVSLACQSSTLISTLDAIISSAEVALPIIAQAVGLPPATLTLITTFLSLVDKAIISATNILASNDTAQVKAQLIIAAFANLTNGCKCIPPGTPQVVVDVINGVLKAISKFLANFTTVTTTPSVLTARPNITIKLKRSDIDKLDGIRVRAEKHQRDIQGLIISGQDKIGVRK